MYVKLFAVIALLIPTLAQADTPPEWQPAYDNSYIRFTTTESGREYLGRITDYTADIRFSPDDLKNSRVSVTIKTDSITRNDPEHDQTLAQPAWFNIQNYPTASFASTDFEAVGDQSYIAHGQLTIKDISHPFDLPFTLQISDDKAIMNAHTTVLRLNYDLGTGDWADTDFIANDVTLDIHLLAHKKTP